MKSIWTLVFAIVWGALVPEMSYAQRTRIAWNIFDSNGDRLAQGGGHSHLHEGVIDVNLSNSYFSRDIT